jgi:radical SAM superfamily enzyme YgiQ (UPF0313 family)
MDLGLETVLRLFSAGGLQQVFDVAGERVESASANSRRILALRAEYERTIGPVMAFLQDEDQALAHLISGRNFLPEAARFAQLEDLEWAFGTMGIRDKARHIATLYLEDMSDLIVELIDPHFGFSRYAERLGRSALSFDELDAQLLRHNSIITDMMLSILEDRIKTESPTLVCLSVPFPGNLFAALKCGQWIKQNHPQIKVAMGGGYPNTELRSVSDSRVFNYVDHISLDDGETPLMQLIAHLDGQIAAEKLKRTFSLIDGQVVFCNGSTVPDIRQEHVGTPDYMGLLLRKYISVIQLTNPMHRLWSDGRWNKLTMAHGCYWGKCTFCDVSLDYIQRYEASSAARIVDRMEELIAQTGDRGFHFVDEAAPPALMKAVALEILRRGVVATWWTNIRFEKSFTLDLCRLLAASGCIAVSGGLEVASDRLLKLIAKGVTIEQVTRVNDHFNRAGIMVHAYLMYGFPTQTAQETIDSLEVVRQMFEAGVMQSAFWHRFAMTAHSPVGLEPERFRVRNTNPVPGSFANNDLQHDDPEGADHDLFAEGLRRSLFNYMHGIGYDVPLRNWFDHRVPKPSVPHHLIASILENEVFSEIRPHQAVVWIGGPVSFDAARKSLSIQAKQGAKSVKCPPAIGPWLVEVLNGMAPDCAPITYDQLQHHHTAAGLKDFSLLWHGPTMHALREAGLLVV